MLKLLKVLGLSSLCALIVSLYGCGVGLDSTQKSLETQSSQSETLSNGDLISYEAKESWPKAVADTLVGASGIPASKASWSTDSSYLESGVSTLLDNFYNFDSFFSNLETRPNVVQYNISYQTNNRAASAAVFIGGTASTTQPIMLFHHGTIFEYSDAPSLTSIDLKTLATHFTGAGGEMSVALLFAYDGYIVVAPDQLGFGDASGVFHPYLISSMASQTSIDAIKAVRTMIDKEEVNASYNTEIYSTGYSEGGYSAMALCKHLIETPVSGMNLKACAPNAAPIDLSTTMYATMTADTVIFPPYLPYLIFAYQDQYSDFPKNSEIFKSSTAGVNYGDQVKSVFDFVNSSSVIWAAMSPEYPPTLNKTPKNLILDDVLTAMNADLAAGTHAHAIRAKLHDNDLHRVHEWTGDYSSVPIQLCTLAYDGIVPLANASNAVANGNQMILKDPSNGTKIISTEGLLAGKTHHALGLVPCIKETKTFFDSKKNGS